MKATVQCRETESRIEDGRLAIQVGEYAPQGCVVDVSWTLDAKGWRADDPTSWLGPDGYWLHATDVMPRLDLDTDRIALSPRSWHRRVPGSEAIPPPYPAALASNWRWIVHIDGLETEQPVRRGKVSAPLDFADVWLPKLERSGMGALERLRDPNRQNTSAFDGWTVLERSAEDNGWRNRQPRPVTPTELQSGGAVGQRRETARKTDTPTLMSRKR
ncbi:hypothetical protein [Thiocystis violascens]|uniref:Uncharacterized protein n=1 Tax=Thiocystis violascens (strain ATCC 17096 / DSM 198 / 6111) TaxID=765911 RepID=I3Y698_THIV6|nr:hypothetical protein [Thiocystis violascens]AFL72516.1 hypothetical protein Thivi_0452 [Thiocystis violascens DSM 198]